ncbi:MAG: MraY family glycosyltransferase [Candidatus Promineifilaceae bacterium]
MQTFIIMFLLAFSVAALGTPGVRQLALWLGFVDAPNGRKLHKDPIPLLGGVAIFGGTAVALLFTNGRLPHTVTGVAVAGSVIIITGLVDDRFGVPAWGKLLAQAVATAVLVRYQMFVRLPLPLFVNYAITFFWLAGISNAINFLDNMDGLSAGISAVAAAFILLLGLQNDQILVSAVAAGVLGGCLGFLRYNFHPARIFMGDAGSLTLGFVLSLLGLQLRFPGNVNFVTWMVPVFILGLPIFDTTLVVISRLRRGVSPNTPGKDHVSHRLVRLGFSQRETVLILYLVAGVFGMMGVYVTEATAVEGYTLGGAAALIGLYFIYYFEKYAPYPVDRKP